MKKERRFFTFVLLAPLLLLMLAVLYEIIGMAVNHAASAWQTTHLIELLETKLSQTEIIDSCTQTGNTSGTGNHVDMLSAVIFRTASGWEEIRQTFQEYDNLDECSFWIKDMESVRNARKKYPASLACLDKMQDSDGLEDCLLLYLNTSAPFPDNMEGH